MACASYQLDMTAATFGACKCGFARAEHGEDSRRPTLKKPVPRISKPIPKAAWASGDAPKPPPPLQPKASGTCPSHPAPPPKATTPSTPASALSSNAQEGSASATGACDNYKLDLNAATFGACVCGYVKKEHRGPAVAASPRARHGSIAARAASISHVKMQSRADPITPPVPSPAHRAASVDSAGLATAPCPAERLHSFDTLERTKGPRNRARKSIGHCQLWREVVQEGLQLGVHR